MTFPLFLFATLLTGCPPCEPTTCETIKKSQLSEDQIAILRQDFGDRRASAALDKAMPEICVLDDSRMVTLLTEASKKIESAELCHIPKALAQVRMRDLTNAVAATTIADDLMRHCPDRDSWFKCSTSAYGRALKEQVVLIAKAGDDRALLSLLEKGGNVRILALGALSDFCPLFYGHHRAPASLRSILPQVINLFSIEDDLVKSLALYSAAGLVSDRAELQDHIDSFVNKQKSPGEYSSHALKVLTAFSAKHSHW